MRPLFGPRTVVEAAFLVAVPVIALEVGLSWYEIMVAGGIAYLLVIVVEVAIWREGEKAPRDGAGAEAEPPAPDAEPVPDPPPPEPVPLPAPPQPAPEPELPPAAAVIPIPASTAPRRWNLWDLERLMRENSGSDPIADEERTFLLTYLRDFAGPDGLLPVDFDDLVRRSFGALVAKP